MSKQLIGTTNLVNATLNQTGGDSTDQIDKSKSELLRQQALSRDFHGTNAAEIFQRHELSRRSQQRHLYGSPKDLVQKVEEDSSDGQITQDSNDTSDDNPGLNSDSSFRGLSHLKSDTSLTQMGSDILAPPGHEGLSSTSLNPYSLPSDNHFFIPVHQLNASRLVTIPSNLMVSPTGMNSNAQMAEEATRKRQLRLLKNKEAAKECRRKKKEYVKCLENRVAVLENQNKTLIEELKSLKELYCQKDVQS